MKNVLFIHRSVGQNLIRDGFLYGLIEEADPPFELTDYDHNTGILTSPAGKKRLGLSFPGGDTRPENYAAIFSTRGSSDSRPVLELIGKYDVIILKSCYPSSDIPSDDALETIKQHYLTVIKFFERAPGQQLILMTSPPLRPSKTTPANARRARDLANWLSEVAPAKDVHVFDFFDLLASPESHEQANMLRQQYRRKLPWDTHPNIKASQVIAPKFIEFLHVKT